MSIDEVDVQMGDGLNVIRLASYLLGGKFDPVLTTFVGESLQTASGLLLLGVKVGEFLTLGDQHRQVWTEHI